MPDDILQTIRQKYPVYANVEDEDLARGLSAKYPVYAPHLQQYLSNTSPPQDEPSVSATAKERLAGGMGQEQIGKTEGPGIAGVAGALAKNVGGRLGEAGKSALEGISNIGPAMMEPRDPLSGLAAGANAALNVPAQALRVGSAIPGAASEEIMKSAGLPPEQSKKAGDLAEQAMQLLTAGKMTAEHAMVQDPETGTMVQKNPLAAPADQKAAAAELAEMKNKPPTPVNPELPVSKTTETAQGPKIEMAADAGPAEKLHEIQHVLADEGKGPEPVEGAQAKQYAEQAPAARGIHEMTRDELEVATEQAKLSDSEKLVQALGEDGAKEFNKLYRASNSMDNELARAAQTRLDEIESKMTPEQQRLVYGIGETGESAEDLAWARQRVGMVGGDTPQELGESMKWALTRVNPKEMPTIDSPIEQKTAMAQLRAGFDWADQEGWDKNQVLQEAIRAAGKRFAPGDREFMLRNYAKPAAAEPQAFPATPSDPLALPPAPDMGTVGAAGNLRPEPVSGELGNLSVEEPAGRPGVMPPELSQQTLRASAADPVTAAYVDLVKSGAVEHDPTMPPGIQIVNALKSGKLAPDEYQKIMDAHGVTELDFATNFGLSVSDAGRMLNKMAQVSKALEDAGLKESTSVDLPPESWLSYYTRRAGRLLQQSTIVGVIKTARNAVSHYLMSGPISSADTIMQSVLQKIQTEVTGRPPDPQFELHMADGFANMAEVSKSFNGGAKELAQKALESMPSQNQRLYGQMLGDLNDTIGGRAKRGGPLDAGFDAADKVLGIANWGLHWNTMHIRSGSFVANADVLLRNNGMGDLETFSKRLAAGDLAPEEAAKWQNIVGQSVTAALKRSFGYAPRASEVAARTGEKVSATEDAAASLVDGINTLPYGKFIPGGMFPRFVYNVVGTYVKQSPLGLLQFVNPAARARFAAGDMSVMTSVITGATLGLAMAGVDQKYGTGKPLEYKFGKDTYTLEPYHPLSFWALYGYAINKAAGGHPDDRGLGTATLGLIAGPEGRAGPGKELANLSDAATQFQAGQQKAALARLAGQRLAGYFTPLNELLNEPQGAELKGTGETVKETKSSNVAKSFLNPIQEKIPYLRESLKDQPRATSTDLSRQGVLGAEGTRNAAEQEFTRIGLKSSDIFHGTGIPEVDDAIKAKMGPLVETWLAPRLLSQGYTSRPEAEKPYIAEQMLTKVRQTAAKQAAQDNPQLFQDKRLMKIPAFKAMFLGSQNEEMKRRLTEAQAQIANQ